MKEFIKNILRDLRGAYLYVRYFRKFKSVGKRCVLKKPMRLVNMQNVEMGDKCWILPGLRMETLEKTPTQEFHPSIKIGNNVDIGQHAHIFCGESIILHDNVSIGAYTMINDCTHGYYDPDMPIKDQDISTAPIEIGENTMIGISCLILPGVTIGKGCYIGGNTVISQDIPDHTIVAAQPPRMVRIPY